MAEFHASNPEAFVFYSRNTGVFGKLTQPAVNKMLKKHAACAHKICDEVPIELHAHQIRHAKATHWLEDGMNIVQISLLLGHEHLQTTMVYPDISNDKKAAALATSASESMHESNRYNEIPEGIDHRTNGYKVRKASMMHKTDTAIQLIRNALSAGIQGIKIFFEIRF